MVEMKEGEEEGHENWINNIIKCHPYLLWLQTKE